MFSPSPVVPVCKNMVLQLVLPELINVLLYNSRFFVIAQSSFKHHPPQDLETVIIVKKRQKAFVIPKFALNTAETSRAPLAEQMIHLSICLLLYRTTCARRTRISNRENKNRALPAYVAAT